MRLFDEYTRSRTTYQGEIESEFDFLNASAFSFVHRVRQYTQDWFDRYPEDAKVDWHRRFISKDDRQHIGAHFELFLHELLLRQGFAVDVHPRVSGVSERPDFRVSNGDKAFYLEAVVIHSSSDDREVTQHERLVREWIRAIDSPCFSFWLAARGELHTQPSKRHLQPILELIAKHDPERVQHAIDEHGVRSAPHTWLRIGDWHLQVTLMPRPHHLHGDQTVSNIAGGPGGGGRPNTSMVAKRIEKKADEKQSSKLDAPLVIAAKVMDIIYQIGDCAVPTLLGRLEPSLLEDANHVAAGFRRQSSGVWVGNDGKARYRNLHAVWLFEAMPTVAPTPTAELASALVFNPLIKVELPSALNRLPHIREMSGRMERIEGVDINHLLGVEHLDRARWEEIPGQHE